MNSIHRTRILLVLGTLGVFILGAITGGLTSLGIAKKRITEKLKANPQENAAFWLENLDRKLDLTESQKSRFRTVLEESLRELQIVRRRSFWAGRQILEKAESQIRPELTPGQQQAYDKLKKERQEKILKLLGGREAATVETEAP